VHPDNRGQSFPWRTADEQTACRGHDSGENAPTLTHSVGFNAFIGLRRDFAFFESDLTIRMSSRRQSTSTSDFSYEEASSKPTTISSTEIDLANDLCAFDSASVA
jgi:hypothetical protein